PSTTFSRAGVTAGASCEALGRAQFRAPSARVAPDLVLAWHDRLLRQHAQSEFSRLLEASKRVLHDPVLERMERDDHEPRACAQPAGRRREKTIQPLQL